MKTSPRAKPSRARIDELLDVDVTSGEIRWRASAGRAKAGDRAGRLQRFGYIEVGVDGQLLKAHAIVWFVATGDWPPLIDHINGDKADNRLVNLRLATASANARNRTNWVHRKLLGAFILPSGKWEARITADSVEYRLGTFETEARAHEAYREARARCEEAECNARTRVLEEVQASRRAVA